MCSYPTVSCGTTSCSGEQFVPAATCNAGSCTPAAPEGCANGYACAANACRTTCASNADCRSEHFCAATTCHRDVVSIATAFYHSCAVLGDGRVYCWGRNTYGQLLGGGTGTEMFSSPVQIAGVTNAVKVAADSEMTCVMTASEGVMCWGHGYIGDGATTDNAKPPTPVVTNTGVPLTGVIALAAGGGAACASTASSLYCWGGNGGLGVDGVPTSLARPVLTATPVVGAASPRSFSIGPGLQVATFDGFKVCPWGRSNDYRQITSSSCNGVASTSSGARAECGTATSFCFDAGEQILQVGAAGNYACARYQSSVGCWGSNGSQELGATDTSILSLAPPGNSMPLSAIDMQVYIAYVCVLLADGVPTVKCWGGPYATEQPAPPPYTAPVTIPASFPVGVKAASLGEGTGASTTCLIANDGSPWCFGLNIDGQVGNSASGSVTRVGTPTQPTITW